MSSPIAGGRDKIPTPRLPITMTFFTGREERVGQRRAATWAQLAARLREPGVRANSHKPNHGQWAFATFRANRRGLETLDTVNGLVLDYDGNPDLTLRDLRGAWSRWAFLAYTTLHHNRADLATRRPEFPRWRLLIPFTEPIDKVQYERVVRWAQLRSGPAGLLDSVAEPGRLFNAPLKNEQYCYDSNHTGVPLDPSLVLAELLTLEESAAQNQARAALETSMPTLASSFGVDELDGGRRRSLISVAKLPGWPAGPETGHGLGKHLDVQLGGGVGPGYVLTVGSRGVGNAASGFLQQFVDGLALRSASILELGDDEDTRSRAVITPVVMLTEAGPSELTWRTLARWTGTDQRLFRAGNASARLLGLKLNQVERAFNQARAALQSRVGQSRSLIRLVQDLPGRGRDLVEPLVERVEIWRRELVEEHRLETWPVVVFDPVEQWLDHSRTGIHGVNELIEVLARTARARGWILLVGTESLDESDGYSALSRLPDACLRLQRPEVTMPGLTKGQMEVEVAVLHNRWGRDEPPYPRYRWESRAGRFLPVSVGEVAALWEDDAGEGAEAHTVMRQAPPKRPQAHTPQLARGGSDTSERTVPRIDPPRRQRQPQAPQQNPPQSPPVRSRAIQTNIPPVRRPSPRPQGVPPVKPPKKD